MGRVATMLSALSANRVFSTGISSCVPVEYLTGIRAAGVGVGEGTLGGALIWTLDLRASMVAYLKAGATGVLTNVPKEAVEAMGSLGHTLSSGTPLVPATAGVSSPVPCDCDHAKQGRRHGCRLSSLPRPGSACKCSFDGVLTCSGKEVPCLDPSDPRCSAPDFSLQTCVLGGGDCSGYRDSDCDCAYRPGGCVLQELAPVGLACHCQYKGAWTCGGRVVACADPASAACKSPEVTSVETCLQGGGDCHGYQACAAGAGGAGCKASTSGTPEG